MRAYRGVVALLGLGSRPIVVRIIYPSVSRGAQAALKRQMRQDRRHEAKT